MPRARDWLIAVAGIAAIIVLTYVAPDHDATRVLVILLVLLIQFRVIRLTLPLTVWLMDRAGDRVTFAVTTLILICGYVAIRLLGPFPTESLVEPGVLFAALMLLSCMAAWVLALSVLGRNDVPTERNGYLVYRFALGWRILLFLIGPVFCVLMLQQEAAKPIHAWMSYAWVPLAGYFGALVLLPQVALGDGEVRIRRWWLGWLSHALADLIRVERVDDGSALELGFADGRKRTVDGMIAGLGDLEARLNEFLPARG